MLTHGWPLKLQLYSTCLRHYGCPPGPQQLVDIPHRLRQGTGKHDPSWGQRG